jgi:hypothetical protein
MGQGPPTPWRAWSVVTAGSCEALRKAQAAAVISRKYAGDVGGGYADSGLGARLIREPALTESWASRGAGQPGRSSGVPATTANRSAIPARVAVCNVAAGTGAPPGTGSSRVAVVLATTVGR